MAEKREYPDGVLFFSGRKALTAAAECICILQIIPVTLHSSIRKKTFFVYFSRKYILFL